MYVPSWLVGHVEAKYCQSLDFLMNLVENPSQLSEGSICRIHEITMKSCRIALYNVCLSSVSIHQCVFITPQDGLDEVFYLTHPGLYRKRLVSTTHMDGGIVQYTHHSKVHSEMKRFVRMMKVSGFSLPLFPLTNMFAELPREEGHLSVRSGSLDSFCIFTYPPFHRECL